MPLKNGPFCFTKWAKINYNQLKEIHFLKSKLNSSQKGFKRF